MRKNIIAIALIFAIFVQSALMIRDVCIIGAGASGMSASVFLKDRGYDVLVIEKNDKVGGHCTTSYYDPPKHGDRNWVDLGVVVFPDTEYENETGIGHWTLGSRQFAQRFLEKDSTIGYQGVLTNYGFDFAHNISTGVLPNPPPSPEYLQEMERFVVLLATKYPWLDNVKFPDPIPAELLEPFGKFISDNKLELLQSFFFPLLYYGGMGNYHNVSALYALQNLRIGIIKIYSDPNAGFAIRGGCYKIYEGISKYIGKKNILLETKILTVQRNKQDYVYIGADVDGEFQKIYCKKILVTVPQLLQNLGFIDLTQDEVDVFEDVVANYYYRFELDVTGPLANDSFNVASIDVYAPDGIPSFPNILALRREVGYGPACCFAYADDDITDETMLSTVNKYLSLIPPTYFTSYTLKNFDRHFYQAHFADKVLSHSPTPYTKLNKLQGQRNTYWAGALFSFAESASVWQNTYDIITSHFPDRNHH